MVKKHGHVIKGIKDLRLGVAYTIGASNSIGAEFVSFTKGDGLMSLLKL